MRVLLVLAVFIGSIPATPPADAGRKFRGPPCYARHVRSPCAVRAWHYRPAPGAWPYRSYDSGSSYDPTGEFRGFPGWARKAFSEPRH